MFFTYFSFLIENCFVFLFSTSSLLNSIKSKCSQYKKTITGKQRYPACSLCSLVFHQKCLVSNMSINGNICVSNSNYMCHNCATAIFPFFSLTNEELLEEFSSAFRISASMLKMICLVTLSI